MYSPATIDDITAFVVIFSISQGSYITSKVPCDSLSTIIDFTQVKQEFSSNCKNKYFLLILSEDCM